MKNKSKVVVFMATYNGTPWIAEQVTSILNQSDVEVELVISDDCSSDNTRAWLESMAKDDSRIILLPNLGRVSSAGKNFYRLIADADISNFDYVSFSDQDDIWYPDKLINHVHLIEKYHVEGVSSNAIAFWPNGKEKLIVKSQPQKNLDYLFESAGPGCTFLMTPWLVNKVRLCLKAEHCAARDVALHDWLTYAICRASGRKWFISDEPTVRYRQHANNVVGANVGLKSKWSRLQKLRQGWYRNEVIKIAQICMQIAPSNKMNRLVRLLESQNYFEKLKLLTYVPNARRSLLDRCMLTISILVGVF